MVTIVDYETGSEIEGTASAELIAASAAALDNGAVAAYLDADTWRPIDDSEVQRYEARGETVRTVWVDATGPEFLAARVTAELERANEIVAWPGQRGRRVRSVETHNDGIVVLVRADGDQDDCLTEASEWLESAVSDATVKSAWWHDDGDREWVSVYAVS